jgi:hypothetical protein
MQSGDSIELLEQPQHDISIRSLWQTVFSGDGDVVAAQLALDSLPFIDAGWIRRLKRISQS